MTFEAVQVCPAGMQEMNTMSSNMRNILCDMPSEAYAVFGMRMVSIPYVAFLTINTMGSKFLPEQHTANRRG